jgi:hypothetical protein
METMIRLQFAAEGGFSSRLIGLYDHGWCSHVDAVLADGSLVGARIRGGVLRRLPGYAPFIRTLRVDIDVSKETSGRFYEILRGEMDKPYDWRAIVAFAVDRDWRCQDSWMCSELITSCLERAGYFSFPPVNAANRITPGDLMLMLSVLTPISGGVP